jgi:hypothetical protein
MKTVGALVCAGALVLLHSAEAIAGPRIEAGRSLKCAVWLDLPEQTQRAWTMWMEGWAAGSLLWRPEGPEPAKGPVIIEQNEAYRFARSACSKNPERWFASVATEYADILMLYAANPEAPRWAFQDDR